MKNNLKFSFILDDWNFESETNYLEYALIFKDKYAEKIKQSNSSVSNEFEESDKSTNANIEKIESGNKIFVGF